MDKKTIDKLNDLCVNLELVSIYDTKCKSVPELLYILARKVNEVILEANRLGIEVSDQLKEMQSKIDNLLTQGLTEAVATQLNNWLADGTLNTIINQTLFGELITQINNESIARKTAIANIPPVTCVNAYSLLRNKDCNVLVIGDSLSQGYLADGTGNLDGSKVQLGVRSFVNDMYLKMLKNTKDFSSFTQENVFIRCSTSSEVWVYDDFNITASNMDNFLGRKGLTIANNGVEKSISFKHKGDILTLWKITGTQGGSCDVYIDGNKARTISNLETSAYNSYDTFLLDSSIKEHSVEIKNFKGPEGSFSYFTGKSNGHHILHNMSYGAKDIKWANDNSSMFEGVGADIIFINFGANDITTMSVSEYSRHFKELYSKLKGLYPNAVYYMWNSTPDKNHIDDYKANWLPVIVIIAKDLKIPLVDSWNYMRKFNVNDWCVDNIHYNILGNKMVSDLYSSYVSSELNEIPDMITDNYKSIYKSNTPLTPDFMEGAVVVTDGKGGIASMSEATQTPLGLLTNVFYKEGTSKMLVATSGLARGLVHGTTCSGGDKLVANLTEGQKGTLKVDNTAVNGVIAVALESIQGTANYKLIDVLIK